MDYTQRTFKSKLYTDYVFKTKLSVLVTEGDTWILDKLTKTARLPVTFKLLYATVVAAERNPSPKKVTIQITGLIIQTLWSRDSSGQIIWILE